MLLRLIHKCFTEHPVISQSVAAGVLYGAADVLAQKWIEQKKNIDYYRLARMSVFAVGLAGPLFSYWYMWLHKYTAKWAQYPAKRIAIKIFYDQCIFEPPALALFFMITSVMEDKKKGWEMGIEKIKKEYVRTYGVDCALWVVVQSFNFALLPPQFNALVVNTVSVGWVTYLSYVRHKEMHLPQKISTPTTVL